MGIRFRIQTMFKKIREFFERIREQPEESRKLWLYLLVSGSMTAIILIWLFTLSLATNANTPKNKEQNRVISGLKSEIFEIKQSILNIGNAVKDFREIFKNQPKGKDSADTIINQSNGVLPINH